MIITCEECRTSFNLDETLLKPTGSKVRCSKCGDVFITFPPPPETAAAVEAAPVAPPPIPEPPAKESPPAAGVGATETPADEEADEIDLGLDLGSDDDDLGVVASEESELPVDDLDLSGLGLDEEDEEEPAAALSDAEAAAADAEHDAELDFSDLDIDDEAADVPEPAAEESEPPAIEDEGELDFSDLDLGLDEEDEAAVPAAEAPADDELDLSDLDLAPEIEEAAAEAAAEAPADDELDLGDLDLGPEMEADAVAPEPDASGGEDELDLGDLDLGSDLEEDAVPPEPAVPGSEDELNLDDLDLDIGVEEEPAALDEAIAPDGDLDLDDLDLDALEEEVEPVDDSDDTSLAGELEEAPLAADDGLDLDDLDLDDVAGAPADEEGLDDLDLGIGGGDDLLSENEVSSQEEIAAGELDISELEAVFDAPDDEDDLAGEEVEEYDLEFDMEMLDDADAAEPEAEALSDSADELDLGEVETMLDGGDEEPALSAGDADAADEELDLDLDLEEMEPDAVGDLSMEGEDAAAEYDGDEPSPAFADTMDMETLEKDSMALESAEAVDDATPAVAPPRPKRKASIGKPVKIFALVFILLAAIGGGLHTAVNVMGIHIPFVSDFLNPQPDNVNRLEIIQGTVRSKFVDNNKAGKLFMITGRVTNGYDMPRNFISITGKLYGKGKKLVATQTVFAGNMLTAIEQATLDLPSINKRLRNRVGEKKKNMNVKPGAGLPFMVVFANLPAQLEEFTVEPGASVSAQ